MRAGLPRHLNANWVPGGRLVVTLIYVGSRQVFKNVLVKSLLERSEGLHQELADLAFGCRFVHLEGCIGKCGNPRRELDVQLGHEHGVLQRLALTTSNLSYNTVQCRIFTWRLIPATAAILVHTCGTARSRLQNDFTSSMLASPANILTVSP